MQTELHPGALSRVSVSNMFNLFLQSAMHVSHAQNFLLPTGSQSHSTALISKYDCFVNTYDGSSVMYIWLVQEHNTGKIFRMGNKVFFLVTCRHVHWFVHKFLLSPHEKSTLSGLHSILKLLSTSMVLVSRISRANDDTLKSFIKHEKQTKKGTSH